MAVFLSLLQFPRAGRGVSASGGRRRRRRWGRGRGGRWWSPIGVHSEQIHSGRRSLRWRSGLLLGGTRQRCRALRDQTGRHNRLVRTHSTLLPRLHDQHVSRVRPVVRGSRLRQFLFRFWHREWGGRGFLQLPAGSSGSRVLRSPLALTLLSASFFSSFSLLHGRRRLRYGVPIG